MDPICVRKFLSFLFINRQTLAQTIFLTLAPLDEAHPLQIYVKCLNGKCITIKVDSFDNCVGFVEDAMEAVINMSKFDTNHTADVRWRRRSHSSGEEVNDFSGGGEIEVGNYERSLENNMVKLPWGRSLSTVITVSLVGEHLRTPLI